MISCTDHPTWASLKPRLIQVVKSIFCRLPLAYSGKFTGSFPLSIRSSSQLCNTPERCSSESSLGQSKFNSNLQAIPEDETPKVLKHKCLPLVPKTNSPPNSKRVSPPHHDCSSSTAQRSRKLILKSIPSFPSFCPPWKLWLSWRTPVKAIIFFKVLLVLQQWQCSSIISSAAYDCL